MKFVLASHNRKKLAEMQEILGAVSYTHLQNCLAGQSDLQSKTGGISDRITRCKEQQAALAAERQDVYKRQARTCASPRKTAMPCTGSSST